MNTIMTPSAIWDGFNPNKGELKTKLIEESETYRRYLFSALEAPECDVLIETFFFYPSFESKKTVLLIGSMERRVQYNLVAKFVNKGYNVFVADYSGVFPNTKTTYPKTYEYGYFQYAGDHAKKVCPTAKETTNYLYTAVLRRCITFIESVVGETDIITVGIKSGVEIALQVAGTEERTVGLVCIAAAGYREYVSVPKYASDRELTIDKDMMNWLTGVSGTAYAKHIKVPVMLAIGSNGTISDIDRVSNLMSLMSGIDVRLTVSSGYRENITKSSLDTVIQWMEGVYVGSTPPELPTVRISVNTEGALCAEIKTDGCIKIKEARIYYSFNDNNHSTRFWRDIPAEYVGNNEYFAKIKVIDGQDKLFVYAETEYCNGLVLDGVVNYTDLKDSNVKRIKSAVNPIIFQHPDENGFIELNDNAVIMESNLCEGILPVGLKGLYCATGGMITYSIGRKFGFDETRLLQIDSYSALKKYTLTVRVLRTEKDRMTEYSVSRNLEVDDTFFSLRLSPGDFKDAKYRPMDGWEGIKSLVICESNIIIGKIMFI